MNSSKGMVTVLLVDDDSDILMCMSTLFDRNIYKVITASSKEGALAILNSKVRIDVLFTDLKLGDGTGAELREVVVKKNRKHRVVSILITGYHKMPCNDFPGFDDYITKPVCDPSLITDTVRSCLQVREEEEHGDKTAA